MRLDRIAALPAAGLLASALALSQKQAPDLAKDALEKAYSDHLVRVQRELPPHSGLPCLLDLSKPDTGQGVAGRKWQERFMGSMGIEPISDAGVSSPLWPTSVSMIFNDYVGTITALPAHNSDAVVIAKPVACNVHLAYNHRFVYTSYSLELFEVLKGKRKTGVVQGKQIIAAQLGGSVRFPSGFESTLLEEHEGFLELGKQYLLFLWKPVRSDGTYAIAEAYLLENGLTFPTMLDAHESAYEGMPVKNFEAKVKAAIANDQNTM